MIIYVRIVNTQPMTKQEADKDISTVASTQRAQKPQQIYGVKS